MTAADAPDLTTRDCKDWALAYADLAAKLAAAEREAGCQSAERKRLRHKLARAEAALVAVQKAMRKRAADIAALRGEFALADIIAALPIPAAKPESE